LKFIDVRNIKVKTEAKFSIPRDKVAEFCKKNRIRKLSLFGSVLRKDFQSKSDIDILVEFESGARVGMIRLAGLEIELGEILGRKVDLNTAGFLSKYYRDRVLSEAEVQYDASR
jgi:predicted nucleotidyltransferase